MQDTRYKTVTELIEEFDSQFGFIAKHNIGGKETYERTKTFYVFEKLAMNFAPSMLQEKPPYSAEDSQAKQ